MASKRFWLLKTEPSVFSFEDLVDAPEQTTGWEGVRNYQARNLLRDEFQIGDEALVYHSSTDIPAVMGVAEIVRAAYPDKTALDPKSKYYDAKAKAKGESPWVLVDVRAKSRLKTPVTRDQLRENAATQGMMVLKRGSRLSVQPVEEAAFNAILKLGKAVPL